jgi:DNA-binding transcriptional regulator PaaX
VNSAARDLPASHRALLYLYREAGQDGVSCFDVGEAVWPERAGRISASGGGGDYAAQMLLGRMKKAGLVEHAPSDGSARWRLSHKGLAAVRAGLSVVLAARRAKERA